MGVGWETGSVTNGPTCAEVQCLEKEMQKVLSDYISDHLNPRSEAKLLNVNCWISWAVPKKLYCN